MRLVDSGRSSNVRVEKFQSVRSHTHEKEIVLNRNIRS